MGLRQAWSASMVFRFTSSSKYPKVVPQQSTASKPPSKAISRMSAWRKLILMPRSCASSAARESMGNERSRPMTM